MLTRRVADEALLQLAKDGRAVNRADVEQAVYLQVQRNVIVFRVEDGAGTPLPLDDRALNRLERMAFYVRNRTAKDWIHAGDIEQYEAKRSRMRAIEAIWEDVRRDSLFTQMVGDALAGLRLRYHVGGPLPKPVKEPPPTPTFVVPEPDGSVVEWRQPEE